jgi:hypothetical protein
MPMPSTGHNLSLARGILGILGSLLEGHRNKNLALNITNNQFAYFILHRRCARGGTTKLLHPLSARAYFAANVQGHSKAQHALAVIWRALSCRFPTSFSFAPVPASDGLCQVCGARIAAPASGLAFVFVLV